MEKPIRIKMIFKGVQPESMAEYPVVSWGNCEFWSCSDLTDYDWLIVYDEVPKETTGTVSNQTEPLMCSPDHTLLVTTEPPSIKLYSTPYTDQFGVVVSSHPYSLLKNKGLVRTGGALEWYYGRRLDVIRGTHEIPKTKVLSTVCSSKQQTHTLHEARYNLTKVIADHIPELEWFGRGVRPMNKKYEVMDSYKYHIAIENYIGPHHWTEKLADSFLALCLPFYVGHESALEYFPEESIIFIPIDDPDRAAQIIREAIDNNEYEKRLPAIREARRLVLEKYNFWAITSKLIEERHSDKPAVPGTKVKGRHVLRRNPLHLLKTILLNLRFKFLFKGE